jgi:hypothetical protein
MMTTSKPPNPGSILLALLEVLLKYDVTGHGQITAVNQSEIYNQKVLRNVLDIIHSPLVAPLNSGKIMLSAAGQIHQCVSVNLALTANYFENIHLHSIK